MIEPNPLTTLLLPTGRFRAMAKEYREAYRTAEPFPHIVIDNFLPEAAAETLLAEFDEAVQRREWHPYRHPHSEKLAIDKEQEMGLQTRYLLGQLNGSDFVSFLEELTGIESLVPDPHLWGGGLHRIEPGGYLDVHADFNWHKRLRLDRRLNLLIYLNKDWEESYGGALELWDANMVEAKKKVPPLFNRCVIFSTTDFAYHGHPLPLTCPPGRARKSFALYYYSNGRPEGEVFRIKSKDTLYYDTYQKRSLSKKARLRRLLPPIVFDWWRGVKRIRKQ